MLSAPYPVNANVQHEVLQLSIETLHRIGERFISFIKVNRFTIDSTCSESVNTAIKQIHARDVCLCDVEYLSMRIG